MTRTVEYLQSWLLFEDYRSLSWITVPRMTPQIAEKLCKKISDKVRYKRINVRSVGQRHCAEVCEVSHSDGVGYMDTDLSTNIRHLGEAISCCSYALTVAELPGSTACVPAASPRKHR